MRQRFLISMTLVLCLAAGCSGPKAAPPPTADTPPPAVESPKPPAPDLAAVFMPADHQALTFALNDQTVTEYLLRDGDRFVAVQDGAVYATWFLRDDGLWRLDPKGGGALLRYLPPVLEDGLTWKQKSGDAEVWFRLARGQTGLDTSVTRDEGWILTVVNRNERLELTFAAGVGPAMAKSENWAVRTDSYTKRAFKVAPGGPGAEQRQAFLAEGVAAPPAPAPVVAVSADEFDAASRAALLASRSDVEAVDLTGDGKAEYIRGPLGGWTTEAIEIFRSSSELSKTFERWEQAAAHRVSPIMFTGDRRTWFIHEQQMGPDNWISITGPLGAELTGWAPKAEFTRGTRVEAAPDGLITVSWELGDPARHRWVRVYRIDAADPTWPFLRQLSSRFEPAETELRCPTDPREVLQAAFIGQWYNLTDELPRYFTSRDAASALASVKPAQYGPGTVEIGTLSFEELKAYPPEVKLPKIQPGPVRPDGTATFLARLPSYETSIFTWGTATFSPGGLIQSLVIEGTAEIM